MFKTINSRKWALDHSSWEAIEFSALVQAIGINCTPPLSSKSDYKIRKNNDRSPKLCPPATGVTKYYLHHWKNRGRKKINMGQFILIKWQDVSGVNRLFSNGKTQIFRSSPRRSKWVPCTPLHQKMCTKYTFFQHIFCKNMKNIMLHHHFDTKPKPNVFL